MGMMGWTLLGVALGIASPFMVLQLQRRRDVARATARSSNLSRSEAARPSNPFAAVSVSPCAHSPCPAVLQMQEQRFLAIRAPRIPVPGCDRQRCTCRYVRHSDRRSPGDRRDTFARFGGLIPNAANERRSRDERRKPR